MIYIFDVESPAFSTTDADYFSRCLGALKTASGRQTSNQEQAEPYVHVLIHKMDLVNQATRDQVFEAKSQEIRRRCQEAGWSSVKIFGTSIWNETLYRVCFQLASLRILTLSKAWSVIVSTFIPNSVSLQNQLDSFADLCNADEVVLFETTTFLVISRSTNPKAEKLLGWEDDRFEKICQCIKMFRLSCSYLLRMPFGTMEMKHRSYSCVLAGLTPNACELAMTPPRRP
jgi:Ras-related GTP-binding protein A/B